MPDPASDFIGNVTNPLPTPYADITKGALTLFLSNIIKFLTIAAGLWALVNFFLAGFRFLSSQGDAKAVGDAWNKIWNSLMGLVIIAVAYALIALLSYLLFGDPTLIISPKIYGPGR